MRRLYYVGKGFDLEGVDRPCSSVFHTVLWARITMPIQAVISMIETIARQGITSVLVLATGITAFDFYRIKMGAVEFSSCIVQLIAFPIIAVVSVFSPYDACELAKWMHGYKENTRYIFGGNPEPREVLPGEILVGHFPNHIFRRFEDSDPNDSLCIIAKKIFSISIGAGFQCIPTGLINLTSTAVCEYLRVVVALQFSALPNRFSTLYCDENNLFELVLGGKYDKYRSDG